MTVLGNWLNEIEQIKSNRDVLIYGTGMVEKSIRSIHNPLFYILGPCKVKRINPINIYKTKVVDCSLGEDKDAC